VHIRGERLAHPDDLWSDSVMHATRRLERSEQGWVVVTAIVLMTIMLGIGLAMFAQADTQSGQSRTERTRESAFNLAEGLLQAESVVLQNNWPSDVPCAANTNSCGYPAPNACSKTGTTIVGNANQCPDADKLAGVSGAFSNVDQALNGTTQNTRVDWTIQVRDDLGVCSKSVPQASAFYDSCQIPTYYKDKCPPPNNNDATKCWPAISGAKYSTNPNQAPGEDQLACKDATNTSVMCTWDANGNKQLWVKVTATVAGKTRSLVALLRLENFPVVLNSKDAVNGGAIAFSNQGNKGIVDAGTSQVVARCTPTTGANPTTGTSLKTALAVDVVTANTLFAVTVPDNATTQAFKNGDVVALGADTGVSSNYELLTISTNVVGAAGFRVITFTSKVQNLHKAADGTNKLELAPGTGNNCETWTGPNPPGVNGADKHQLDNYYSYKSDPNYPPFLSQSSYNGVVAALKPWTTCPPDDFYDGNNVYIKSLPAGTTCTLPHGTLNSSADPHFIIVENELPINAGTGFGTCNANPPLEVSNNTVYYGVIYMRNMQQCGFNQVILNIQAGAQIQGGVAIDGNAKVNIGNASNSQQCPVGGGNSSCPTIKFDPVAFGSVAASGAAGLVQNTWRELAPGQY
jgi:Tfp pilus assembly protein PilX